MSRFQEFLEKRRSPDTATNYRRCILKVVDDPDEFLKLAKSRPAKAEKALVDYFSAGKVSGAYQRMKYSALKSFLDFYDVDLRWKKIASVMPAARKVAIDRAPSRDEIAKMLEHCDLRTRMVVLCMASGGFRLGAWKWLNVGDVGFLGGGIAKLRIYRGEAEEYFTFVGPEAEAAIQEYLEVRRRAGENLTPDSPLARDKWDFTDFRKKVDVRLVYRLKQNGVAMSIWRAWVRSGMRTRDSKWRPKDFKMAHGFRKYFKTNAPACKDHGPLDAEVLMGHYLNYYKPTEEHLLEYYRSAVPYLSIDEKYRLKDEMQRKDKEHTEGVKDLKLDYLTLKDELADERKAREILEKNMRLIMKYPGLLEKMREHSRKEI